MSHTSRCQAEMGDFESAVRLRVREAHTNSTLARKRSLEDAVRMDPENRSAQKAGASEPISKRLACDVQLDVCSIACVPDTKRPPRTY